MTPITTHSGEKRLKKKLLRRLAFLKRKENEAYELARKYRVEGNEYLEGCYSAEWGLYLKEIKWLKTLTSPAK
jgi:hypothetical protein